MADARMKLEQPGHRRAAYRRALIKICFAIMLPLLFCACSLTTTKVVVVTATPSRPTPTNIASASPAAFTLAEKDVPANMQQSGARVHSNAQVARAYGIDVLELRRRGRITSYETEFRAKAVTGMLDVDDVVASWKTSGGARWDYDRVVMGVRHPGVREFGVQPISAPQLGDRRTVLSFRSQGQAENLRDYAVVFTRGRYRVYLQVVAVYGTVEDGQVLRLARTIDQRIERAP